MVWAIGLSVFSAGCYAAAAVVQERLAARGHRGYGRWAAAVGLTVRVLLDPFVDWVAQWQQIVVAVAALSIALGSFAAAHLDVGLPGAVGGEGRGFDRDPGDADAGAGGLALRRRRHGELPGLSG